MCDSRGLVCRERHSFCFGVVHNNSLGREKKVRNTYFFRVLWHSLPRSFLVSWVLEKKATLPSRDEGEKSDERHEKRACEG